jgi:hypothetical protein
MQELTPSPADYQRNTSTLSNAVRAATITGRTQSKSIK